MPSEYRATLVNFFDSYGDEIDISIEEFVDFLIDMSMIELADVITIAITLPNSSLECSLNRIIVTGITEAVYQVFCPRVMSTRTNWASGSWRALIRRCENKAST